MGHVTGVWAWAFGQLGAEAAMWMPGWAVDLEEEVWAAVLLCPGGGDDVWIGRENAPGQHRWKRSGAVGDKELGREMTVGARSVVKGGGMALRRP